MKIKLLLLGILFISSPAFSQSENFTASDKKKIQADLNEVLTDIENNYVYFDKKGIDIKCLKSKYTKKIKSLKNKNDKILFFEYLLDEFYDSHLHLNVSIKKSYRLYSPIYAVSIDGKVIIKNVWQNQISNLTHNIINAEIITFNGKKIKTLIDSFPTFCNNKTDEIARDWIINKIFSGRYNEPRILKLKLQNGDLIKLDLDDLSIKKHEQLLSKNIIDNIGVIIINNSLGESALISAFDEVLHTLMQTDGLIIDLRNSVDGGDTYIARGIMSRFIDKDLPYQKHSFNEYDEGHPVVKRSWIEFVSPRSVQYKKPLVVLVGRWTGSMGEGLAIGFEGMGRGQIIGTEMERLAGSIEGFSITNSDFGFSLPTEKLFHINGTPREEYIPTNYVAPTRMDVDEILEKGIEIIKNH